MTDSISPDITSTNAIPAIYAKDSTVKFLEETRYPLRTFTQWIVVSDQSTFRSRLKSTCGYLLSSHLQTIMELSRFAWKTPVCGLSMERVSHGATADDFVWICSTRMYFRHLQITLGSKLVWLLVQTRLS
jgi:hypothetical protein